MERAEQKRPEFEEMLEQSVEEGVGAILGQSGLQMLLRLCPLDRLASDPMAFHEVLKGIFMQSGAVVIEREVARRLLDRVAKARPVSGRVHRWWLTGAISSAGGAGRTSAGERRVLEQYAALAALPAGHSSQVAGGTASIEITSTRFASAFKKRG